MKKALFLLLATASNWALADVTDNLPNFLFVYTPSTGTLKTQDGTEVTPSYVFTHTTGGHRFNPGNPFSSYWWGIGHIFDNPVAGIRMTKPGSDDSFFLKAKIRTAKNIIAHKPYYSSWSGFANPKNLDGHSVNTGNCVGAIQQSSSNGTFGTETTYNYSGWDETAPACTGQARMTRASSYTTLTNSNKYTNTVSNEFSHVITVETPDGTPEAGTYTGQGQINWRTRIRNSPAEPVHRVNTVNFNYTVIVEPEYHRVEAPSEVRFSESLDPNHRKTSFYADIYGIFSPQMMVTATSTNGTGTEFKMNCNECLGSYPGIADIQDIVYEVEASIVGANGTHSLQSGVTNTIDLARDANGFFGGDGIAKVRFELEYDRSDSTTTVATDLSYEDTLTLMFEPVI